MLRSSNIQVMTNTILKASKLVRRDFNEIEKLQNSKIGAISFVNNSIRNIEEVISIELSKARPENLICFYDEENKLNNKNKLDEHSAFIIKPISGVHNFSKGISFFSLSILLLNNNKPEAAVIYDPIKNELFITENGQGAFVNNSRMRISGNRNINNAVILLENEEILYIKKLNSFFKKHEKNIRILRSTCLDLATLASGRVDCYICKNKLLNYEPGFLMVRESGGVTINKREIEDISFISSSFFLDTI